MNNLDVFISYSHKDKVVADTICHSFEHEKIKCWMAPRDIKPGDNWATTIVDAIPSCKIMLVVFSSHSNMSKQVLREVEIAVNSGLTIVPVRIEEIVPTGGMKYYLSTLHWIDTVDDDMEQRVVILLETVSGILDGQNRTGWLPSKSNVESLSTAKKRNNIILPLSIAGAVVLVGILLFAFRDSIFGADKEDALNNQPTEQIAITAEPTSEPTAEVTAEPTPEVTEVPENAPTATIDPNLPLDTPVVIPDSFLRFLVMNSLSIFGVEISGAIKIDDMHMLEEIVVGSEHEHLMYPADYFEYGSGTAIDSGRIIASLEGLQYAKNLDSLIAGDVGLEDISALSQIESLQLVMLRGNNITDISALTSSSIQYLTLTGNDNIENMEELLTIDSLKVVRLDSRQAEKFKDVVDELTARGCEVEIENYQKEE